MRWVAEDKFCGEAADGDVSAAESVKEGGVGRGAEGTGDICGEGSVFKVRDRGCSGVDGEGWDKWGEVGGVGWRLRGGWGWDVESPHVLTSLFGANEDGCRVSRGKNRKRGGGEETRAEGLKEGGDCEKGV